MADEQDYFQKYLREGKQSPDDAKYDPELKALLSKLYDRQREEAHRRFHEQRSELVTGFGSQAQHAVPPKIWNDHRGWDKQQNERFSQERQRYIAEHQRAKVILSEMRETEKRQSMDQKLDDAPRRSK